MPQATPRPKVGALERAIEIATYGPRVLRRRSVFRACKAAYWRRYKPEQPLGDIAGYVRSLQRDGVVVIERWMGAERIAAINAELKADLDRLAEEGTLEGKPVYFVREQGIARVMEVSRHYPATEAFFEDEMIKAVARAYVSADVKSYLRMAELRREVGAISTADLPHMDDWRMRFKAFLLLNDVDAGHAPFVYYKGSHLGGRWRADSEYEYFRDGNTGRFGHFFLQEWERIAKAERIEKLVCTGGAGTLILTDTRGVHHGTPVKTGPRYLLGNYFNVRSDGQ